MPLVLGHTSSLRQPPAPAPEEIELDDATIHVQSDQDNGLEPNGDRKVRNDKGDVIKIMHADGGVTVSLNGDPIERAEQPEVPGGWFANLMDRIDANEISRITDDLLRDIDDDIESRREWIEDRAIGMKLMGTKVELPNSTGSAEGAPVEGMSKVRHPLLLEAVLRFQANARGEMLPTDGPVKIRNDESNPTLSSDQLANALERDMNHFLTSTASEYYPDTDRMFLMLGFGGTAFKKVYFCPLRNRPVSETVDAADLIVNNATTDLGNAKRITHRSMVKPSTIKRLQILGVYNDAPLADAQAPQLDAVQREKMAQEGIKPDANRAEDRYREIYEVLCELNVKGLEHKLKGKETGLEIPYRVTIDVSTKTMLAITRNYDKDDEDLPTARKVYVKYTFVPGFGFYDLGLLNILGNTTNAVTAAWRELLDAGMFSSFPGFLLSDTGARQNSNIFRIAPGSAALVKTGGQKISDAVMNLPYREPSMALMQLAGNMAETGQRVGGTAELQVAEGSQEAPVGTTLAMIEQAQKVLNSVHKRVHQSQAEEFQLLVECFRDNPESFWKRNRRPAQPWDEATFRRALAAYDLVPKADPNTASYLQRALKVMGVKQLQSASPTLYDPIKVDTAVLQTMGWSNPNEFFASKEAQGQPPPELQQAIEEGKIKKQDADSRTLVAQSKAKEVDAKIGAGAYSPDGSPQGLGAADMIKAKAVMMDAETRRMEIPFKHEQLKLDHADKQTEDRNRDLDRQNKERLAVMQLAKDIMHRQHEGEGGVEQTKLEHEHALEQQSRDHEHEASEGEKQRAHDAAIAKAQAAAAAKKPKPSKGKKK